MRRRADVPSFDARRKYARYASFDVRSVPTSTATNSKTPHRASVSAAEKACCTSRSRIIQRLDSFPSTSQSDAIKRAVPSTTATRRWSISARRTRVRTMERTPDPGRPTHALTPARAIPPPSISSRSSIPVGIQCVVRRVEAEGKFFSTFALRDSKSTGEDTNTEQKYSTCV